jgi:hypothetical protein
VATQQHSKSPSSILSENLVVSASNRQYVLEIESAAMASAEPVAKRTK